MAARGSLLDSFGGCVAVVLMGLPYAVIGVAGLTNYRGFADHGRSMHLRVLAFLLRIPPWKWMRPIDLDNPPRSLRFPVRSICIVFVLFGTATIVTGITGMVKHS